MLLCPTCSRELADAPICKCGTDLGLLQAIAARADQLFNQALAAAQAGELASALEYLAANALLAPADIEARIVQAKLLAQLKRWKEVEAIVERIAAADPGHQGLVALWEVLGEIGRISDE